MCSLHIYMRFMEVKVLQTTYNIKCLYNLTVSNQKNDFTKSYKAANTLQMFFDRKLKLQVQ